MSKENNVKQVIVIRNDLRNQKGEKVRSGKLIAQACHASMGVILDMMPVNNNIEVLFGSRDGIQYKDTGKKERKLVYEKDSSLSNWFDGLFTKVCLQCNSEEELLELYNKAKKESLPCKLIIDSGLTEFGGVPTKTCIAIGPDYDEKINKITGHLKLL